MKKIIGTFIILTTISLNIMAQQKIVQTAGRTQLGEFAPEFAHLNDDILFGEVWSRMLVGVDSWFAHLAFEIPGENTSNEWLEAVSDEEYRQILHCHSIRHQFETMMLIECGIATSTTCKQIIQDAASVFTKDLFE